jgi:arginine-tRNA-protein transferase
MFTEKHFPKSISGPELDEYLEKGWYRMGQAIFTCHFLFFNDNLYSPIWIRLPLVNYSFRKSLRKLINRSKRNFTTTTGPARITLEKELLYQKYRANFDGRLSLTVKDSLNDSFETNIYNTYEVCVFHGKKLVAFSFFDLGEQSMASIKGVYDPAYAGHSLGFFTMLEEMKFGLDHGLKYYYPGYIVPGYSRFDYKLRVGKVDEIEYYDLKSKAWKSYANFDEKETPIEVLSEKLLSLGRMVSESGIASQVLFYPAYEAKLFGYANERFLESPLFLNCFNNVFPRPRFIVFYDIWKEKYVFTHCMPLEDLGFYFEYSMQFDTFQAKHFLDFIMKKSQIIETENIEEVFDIVVKISKLLKPPSNFKQLMK